MTAARSLVIGGGFEASAQIEGETTSEWCRMEEGVERDARWVGGTMKDIRIQSSSTFKQLQERAIKTKFATPFQEEHSGNVFLSIEEKKCAGVPPC